jgi:hypothetical protein
MSRLLSSRTLWELEKADGHVHWHAKILAYSPSSPPTCLFSLSPSRKPPLHPPPLFLPSVLVRCIHSYLPRIDINLHSMSSGVPAPPRPPAGPVNRISEATLPTPVSSPPSASLRWPWQDTHTQSSFHDFLKSEVDPELSAVPLAAYCFMTGWMCAALTYLLSLSRDSLIPYRTAMQCLSPLYSFGARSKLATRCRCIIVHFPRVSSACPTSINHK